MSTRKTHGLTLSLTLALLAAMPATTGAEQKKPSSAASPKAEPVGPLATVRGQALTLDHVRRLPSRDISRLKADPKGLLDAAIDRRLLLERARRLGVLDNADLRKKLDDYRRTLLASVDARVRAYEERLAIDRVKTEIQKSASSSKVEERAYYKANRATFEQPLKVRLSAIVCREEEDAKKAFERIQAGEDFAAIAASLGRRNRGDVGWWSATGGARKLPEPVAKVVFDMKPGQLTPVLKVDSHWDIVKVTARTEAKSPTFEEVRPQVRGRVLQLKREAALAATLAAARKKMDVTIDANAYQVLAAAFPSKSSSCGGCGSGQSGGGGAQKSGGCRPSGGCESGGGCGSPAKSGGGCGGHGK